MIYCAADLCPTCESFPCRCVQDAPATDHFVVCARCDTESDHFDDEEEMVETLTHEGWSCGRPDFADLCPSCIEDMDWRAARRWATA